MLAMAGGMPDAGEAIKERHSQKRPFMFNVGRAGAQAATTRPPVRRWAGQMGGMAVQQQGPERGFGQRGRQDSGESEAKQAEG